MVTAGAPDRIRGCSEGSTELSSWHPDHFTVGIALLAFTLRSLQDPNDTCTEPELPVRDARD